MSEINYITKADVPSIVGSIPKGAIFTVTFIKKNGEVREMNCRKGVVCGLVPNARPKAANPSNIITVYDMKIAQTLTENEPKGKAYRNINADTVMSIKAERQVFEVR
jgi:hypothetical protein